MLPQDLSGLKQQLYANRPWIYICTILFLGSRDLHFLTRITVFRWKLSSSSFFKIGVKILFCLLMTMEYGWWGEIFLGEISSDKTKPRRGAASRETEFSIF
jgi:hypothetical protein